MSDPLDDYAEMTKMRIAFHEARPDVELSWFLQHYKDGEFLVLVEPPVLTPMSLSVAEEWPISSAPWLRVRRVGWLDQKGRVWTEIPPSSEFDGGSLTPLLIQLEDKFEPPVLSRGFLDSLIEKNWTSDARPLGNLPWGAKDVYDDAFTLLRDAILESLSQEDAT